MPEENKTSISPDKRRELEAQLHKASKENRILCTSALAIAKSLNIPSSEVGKAANILKIKISKCQLGCF